MSGQVEVRIDEQLCVGSTMCVGLAPESLELDDDGRPSPVSARMHLTAALEDAVEGCPVGAISVHPVA